jgi:hypothetical protein
MRLGASTLTQNTVRPTVAGLTANLFNIKRMILSFIFYILHAIVYKQKVSFQPAAQFILLLIRVSAAHRSLPQVTTSVKIMHSVL